MKKLNKTGFTLIELLAVIVILGILLLTAIPAVTKNIAKSRRNTYWQNAKSYVKAATTPYLNGEYYKVGDTDTVCPLPGSGQYVVIPLTIVELEQGDTKKSSFNSPYASKTGTNKNCEPMIIVANIGTSEQDNLQWYFVGMDQAGNGINFLTNINDLNIKSVVTGSSCSASDLSNLRSTSAPKLKDSRGDWSVLARSASSSTETGLLTRVAICTSDNSGTEK